MTLKQVLESTETRAGRACDLVVQALVVVSLLSFSIETLPDLDPRWLERLEILEALIVGFFTIEYVLRIAVADHKLRFVFSFFGIADLLAILPYYLALGVDLRSLRAFRLLRIFQILKLARYGRAVRRLRLVTRLAREELVLFGCLALIALYLAAVGIYYFERQAQPEHFASIFQSLWWAVATLTTVGYGDVYPVTVGGRCFTFAVLMIGLGIVALPTGLVASALSRARELEGEEAAQTAAGAG